jgi:ribosomal protein S26
LNDERDIGVVIPSTAEDDLHQQTISERLEVSRTVLVVVVFVSCCGTVAIVTHVDSTEKHDTIIPLDYTMTVRVGQRLLWLPSLHSNMSVFGLIT